MTDILAFTAPVNRELSIRLRLSAMAAEAAEIAKLVNIHSDGSPDDLECALDDIALLEEGFIEIFGALGGALDADVSELRRCRRALFAEAFEAPIKERQGEWEAEAADQHSGWSDYVPF